MQSKYYISGSKDSDYYNPLLDKDYCEKVDEIEDKDKKIKNSLTYKEDKKLFNYWYIVCLIGNVSLVSGNYMYHKNGLVETTLKWP